MFNTTVLANQTKIEVLSLPVSSISAKPFVELQSDGRFIVYFNGFVEPENLKERYITVGGQLAGTEKGQNRTS
ncbi:starvation-inducible outer membrane lipoprotein [Haemophilus influenzae]|uniref:Starvation-inducible outer membrane lipoprotein n=1 Tax=Haemophilus influenzae TaxID=727 RepID=A0A2X1PLF1_HAEIF|nr:starvation-inducible outer membrane lipoprotein [Haemophilus influenzae]